MNNFNNIKSPKILVLGDLMIDQYMFGDCERISPEAPIQILKVVNTSKVLGGAGNVINNLKILGADVCVTSVIGDDDKSQTLIKMLDQIEVASNLVIEKDRKTTTKTRLIASNQQIIRYDEETSQAINKESERKVIKSLKDSIKNSDIIVISDYAKGLLTESLVKEVISMSSLLNKKVLVDPKGKDFKKYKGSFLMTPNKKEASEATGIYIKDNKSLLKAIKILKNNLDLEFSLITLSEGGIAIFDDKLEVHPTVAKEVYDVTGAGDTVISTIAYCIASQLDISQAISFANLAAGIVVGKPGTATASIDEIFNYQNNLINPGAGKIFFNTAEFKNTLNGLKNKKKNIVFTNGCFDILHAGHIDYLNKSKECGDILIVGLNSDRSVKKLKGNSRPINNESDRLKILAALKSIDFVILFDEETPLNLIRDIRPDTIVKGGDYKKEDVIGRDVVEKVIIIPFTKGKSTTSIINKIKKK